MATANIKAVITAEDRASATLGAFGNNVDALGSKITGALKVAGVAAFAAVATGIIAATKASWDQVDAVQQATVGLKAYERDGNKVNAVLKDLVSYARSDLGVLFNRKDLFQSAQSLKLMGDNTDDLVGHVKILSRSVGLGLSNWDELNLIVGRVGSTGRLTGEDFDNLTKAGFKLDAGLRNTNITFADLFKQLDKGIPSDALAGQADTVQGKMIRLETAFRGVGDAILGVDKETGKFAKGGIGEAIVTTIDNITKALNTPEFKQGIRDSVKALGEGFKIFYDIVVQILTVLQPLTDWIKNNDSAMQGLQKALIGLGILIGVTIIAIGLIVYAFVLLSTALLDVSNRFQNFLGQVYGAIGQFVSVVSGGIGQAVAWFQSLPGRIIGALGNLGGLLFNAGKSIIDGFVSGIMSVANAPANAMKGVLSNLQKLLPHSPAKEGPFSGRGWTLYSGMAISEALAEGIAASGGQAIDAMSGVAGGVSGAIGASGSFAPYSSPGTVVTQNTPTPNITIQVGAFMGTQTDARKLAKMVFDSYRELQAMGNA